MREAARTAKDYIIEIFADEQITNVGLEEVVFEDMSNNWKITIGFSRPWDYKKTLLAALGDASSVRSYKVVNIDDESGRVRSVKHRTLIDAD